MDEEIKKLINYAEKVIEQAKKIQGMQNGLIYTNICKNCGKEIKVSRKNIRYCDEQCKKEYNKKKCHNYYKNMSEEDKAKNFEEAKNRMRELRAKRKEYKNKEE